MLHARAIALRRAARNAPAGAFASISATAADEVEKALDCMEVAAVAASYSMEVAVMEARKALAHVSQAIDKVALTGVTESVFLGELREKVIAAIAAGEACLDD